MRPFIYRYIIRESCSQFDSLPLTSLRDPVSRWDERFTLHTSISASGGARNDFGAPIPTQVWRHPLLRRDLDPQTARRVITRGGSVAHRKEMEQADRLWRLRNAHGVSGALGSGAYTAVGAVSSANFLKRKRPYHGASGAHGGVLLSPATSRVAALGRQEGAPKYASPRTKASLTLLGLSDAKRRRGADAVDVCRTTLGVPSGLTGRSMRVSFLLCTVTFYANLAHSLTRSP